jgi:MFS transporter, FSR family, fosmidomycin resistance protein
MSVTTKKLAAPSVLPVYGILFAISSGHFINDTLQAVVPAMFPILEKELQLTYTEIGWIAFMLNMTSSVLQPVFGYFADRKPSPFLLPIAMLFSMIGVLGYAMFQHFLFLLLAVMFIGMGSAIFHPEGSRVAYMAAGNRRGFAQSIYQVGGNTGQSLAPIITAFILVPLGQKGAALFMLVALLGAIILYRVSLWYRKQTMHSRIKPKHQTSKTRLSHIPHLVKGAIALLIFLVFVRSWYGAAISNFYQFYLIEDYGLSIREAQIYVFIFMFASVIGTFIGGPIADRIGKRTVIFGSLLGGAPFALMLPHVPLIGVIPVLFLLGIILFSSFSVTVVYAQELVPRNVGMVSGLIVGLAFGMGAIGAVFFGGMADAFSIRTVMVVSSFLPLFGLLTWRLPSDHTIRSWYQ